MPTDTPETETLEMFLTLTVCDPAAAGGRRAIVTPRLVFPPERTKAEIRKALHDRADDIHRELDGVGRLAGRAD